MAKHMVEKPERYSGPPRWEELAVRLAKSAAFWSEQRCPKLAGDCMMALGRVLEIMEEGGGGSHRPGEGEDGAETGEDRKNRRA